MNDAAQTTLNWIHGFIVEYNICPFAKRVLEQNGLAIDVVAVDQVEASLEAMMSAIFRLDDDKQVETILLVFPKLLQDFMAYLDFVELADRLLLEQGYEGIYQLATFHPDYCFEGVDPDDVSNYTNRSPYPMLHLLREDSVEKAIQFYGDTDKIPKNNIALMHQLGLQKIKQILSST